MNRLYTAAALSLAALVALVYLVVRHESCLQTPQAREWVAECMTWRHRDRPDGSWKRERWRDTCEVTARRVFCAGGEQ